MSDYWVKPTIEQLQAELEWERGQMKLRRKRLRILASAFVIAAALVTASFLLPGGFAHMQNGYALEETQEEATETPTAEYSGEQTVVQAAQP